MGREAEQQAREGGGSSNAFSCAKQRRRCTDGLPACHAPSTPSQPPSQLLSLIPSVPSWQGEGGAGSTCKQRERANKQADKQASGQASGPRQSRPPPPLQAAPPAPAPGGGPERGGERGEGELGTRRPKIKLEAGGDQGCSRGRRSSAPTSRRAVELVGRTGGGCSGAALVPPVYLASQAGWQAGWQAGRQAGRRAGGQVGRQAGRRAGGQAAPAHAPPPPHPPPPPPHPPPPHTHTSSPLIMAGGMGSIPAGLLRCTPRFGILISFQLKEGSDRWVGGWVGEWVGGVSVGCLAAALSGECLRQAGRQVVQHPTTPQYRRTPGTYREGRGMQVRQRRRARLLPLLLPSRHLLCAAQRLAGLGADVLSQARGGGGGGGGGETERDTGVREGEVGRGGGAWTTVGAARLLGAAQHLVGPLQRPAEEKWEAANQCAGPQTCQLPPPRVPPPTPPASQPLGQPTHPCLPCQRVQAGPLRGGGPHGRPPLSRQSVQVVTAVAGRGLLHPFSNQPGGGDGAGGPAQGRARGGRGRGGGLGGQTGARGRERAVLQQHPAALPSHPVAPTPPAPLPRTASTLAPLGPAAGCPWPPPPGLDNREERGGVGRGGEGTRKGNGAK